jgi:hypothetical protein
MRTDHPYRIVKRFSFVTKLVAEARGGGRRKTAEPLDALQISQIQSLEGTQISCNSTRFTYIFQIELCAFQYNQSGQHGLGDAQVLNRECVAP